MAAQRAEAMAGAVTGEESFLGRLVSADPGRFSIGAVAQEETRI
jgi:hypothetical protein